jgi:hypothetical protein
MMTEVVNFTGITTVPERPETFLKKAEKWGLDRCLIAGWSDSGKFCFGASFSDVGELLILLEKAKRDLLESLER